MASHQLLPRLQIANFQLSSDVDNDHDSHSPYPPSSPSTCSEIDEPISPARLNIRASIANVPDAVLRSILINLAESDIRIHHAIIQELLPFADTQSEPSNSALRPPKKNRKSKSRRNHKRLSLGTTNDTRCAHIRVTQAVQGTGSDVDEEIVYHPGQLQEELYEFLSGAPQTVRPVTMWSCCDEDERSPGCAYAPPSILSDPSRVGLHRSEDHLTVPYADTLPDSPLEGSRGRTLSHGSLG